MGVRDVLDAVGGDDHAHVRQVTADALREVLRLRFLPDVDVEPGQGIGHARLPVRFTGHTDDGHAIVPGGPAIGLALNDEYPAGGAGDVQTIETVEVNGLVAGSPAETIVGAVRVLVQGGAEPNRKCSTAGVVVRNGHSGLAIVLPRT